MRRTLTLAVRAPLLLIFTVGAAIAYVAAKADDQVKALLG